MKTRIPKRIKEVAKSSGSMGFNFEGDFCMSMYFDGQVTVVACKGGRRDYFLWCNTRQQRLAEFSTAREMWEKIDSIIEAGPDRFGLCQEYRPYTPEEIVKMTNPPQHYAQYYDDDESFDDLLEQYG